MEIPVGTQGISGRCERSTAVTNTAGFYIDIYHAKRAGFYQPPGDLFKTGGGRKLLCAAKGLDQSLRRHTSVRRQRLQVSQSVP